jgi:hypothetical protein
VVEPDKNTNGEKTSKTICNSFGQVILLKTTAQRLIFYKKYYFELKVCKRQNDVTILRKHMKKVVERLTLICIMFT